MTNAPAVAPDFAQALQDQLAGIMQEEIKARPLVDEFVGWEADMNMGDDQAPQARPGMKVSTAPILKGGGIGQGGKITIYSTLDGEPREILLYNLARDMRKKLDIGLPTERPAFSMRPTMPFALGEFKCMFHPESEERPMLDSIGLKGRVCMSAHLASVYDRRMHAEHKHDRWWKVYQENKAEAERAEEREWRRLMLRPQVGSAMAPNAAAPEETKPGRQPMPVNPDLVCEYCGQNDFVMKAHLANHVRRNHPEATS